MGILGGTKSPVFSEQPEQREQREQREQPEQSEQSEQYEQREQLVQFSQFFRLSSAACAASCVPNHSTEHLLSFASSIHVVMWFSIGCPTLGRVSARRQHRVKLRDGGSGVRA